MKYFQPGYEDLPPNHPGCAPGRDLRATQEASTSIYLKALKYFTNNPKKYFLDLKTEICLTSIKFNWIILQLAQFFTIFRVFPIKIFHISQKSIKNPKIFPNNSWQTLNKLLVIVSPQKASQNFLNYSLWLWHFWDSFVETFFPQNWHSLQSNSLSCCKIILSTIILCKYPRLTMGSLQINILSETSCKRFWRPFFSSTKLRLFCFLHRPLRHGVFGTRFKRFDWSGWVSEQDWFFCSRSTRVSFL